jgi:tetrapyrrole methylase family protein/MazG family protein
MKAKKKEIQRIQSSKKQRGSALERVPEGLPALSLAYRLTKEASRLGFDWPDLEGVLRKLDEETKEFREALSCQNRKRIREELGDLLFVLVNLARFLRINPEEALRKTVQKFTSRFRYIETALRKKRKTFAHSNLIEMDRLWEEAKNKRK